MAGSDLQRPFSFQRPHMIGGGRHAPKAKMVGDLPEGRNHPFGLLKRLNEIQNPSLFCRELYHTVLANTVHQDGTVSSAESNVPRAFTLDTTCVRLPDCSRISP